MSPQHKVSAALDARCSPRARIGNGAGTRLQMHVFQAPTNDGGAFACPPIVSCREVEGRREWVVRGRGMDGHRFRRGDALPKEVGVILVLPSCDVWVMTGQEMGLASPLHRVYPGPEVERKLRMGGVW